MSADLINNISLGTLCAALASLGVLAGFFGKYFARINQLNRDDERIGILERRVDNFERKLDERKEDILLSLKETNTAVNLLCSAISALIDNELTENGSIEELKRIKQRLDDKKELV